MHINNFSDSTPFHDWKERYAYKAMDIQFVFN